MCMDFIPYFEEGLIGYYSTIYLQDLKSNPTQFFYNCSGAFYG